MLLEVLSQAKDVLEFWEAFRIEGGWDDGQRATSAVGDEVLAALDARCS